jgi:serine protease Do
VRRIFGAVIALSLLAATGAMAADPENTTPPLFGAANRPVNLSRVVFDLAVGQKWGEWRSGLLCIPRGDLKWREGRVEFDDNIFPDIFRRELRAVGFESGSDSLFEGAGDASGEFTLGARVKSVDAQICRAHSQYVPEMEKGSVSFEIEWQVYSRLQRKVVATIPTTGSFAIEQFHRDNVTPIMVGAFRRNVVALTEAETFRKIFVVEPSQRAAAEHKPQSTGPIVLSGASPTARPVSEASGSVVAVLAGGGFGTGFLVSADGYIITNEHVVGSETKVRIRWSDGFESDGEVIRTHKARDVALVLTSPHGRQALTLHRGVAAAGSTVFAVGTPLDLKFQGTVTKGIVSANRIFDGFSFIQSDVGVSHGNSGGPLLDEKGAVVGITDWGHREDGEPANLNFFIPIGDALDFLNLKAAP